MWWSRRHLRPRLVELHQNQLWWTQFVSISVAAILTYSYNNSSTGTTTTSTNVQVAIMTVITFIGASPMCDQHILTASLGAFVGGHNIIGATGLEHALADTSPTIASYAWLLILSAIVSGVWRYGMNHPRNSNRKILDGYAGRLGTTTFIGMNLTQLAVWGPLGVVDWNRYIFGMIRVIHIAEEADATGSDWKSAWPWIEAATLAIGYILAVVGLSMVAGGSRIWHAQYIQHWHDQQQQQQQQEHSGSVPIEPLNNVLVPCLWALLSMMLVNMTQYTHAPGIYNGFAVGAYVAMASLEKLNSVVDFMAAGGTAAAWGLTLTPFFVGFAGKAGFTAMLGHVTYEYLLQPLLRKLHFCCWWPPQHHSSVPLQNRLQVPSNLSPPQSPSQQQQQQQQQPSSMHPPLSPISPSHTVPVHHPPKEVFYSKQQRRQKQRLQSRSSRRQPPPGPSLPQQQPPSESHQGGPVLTHRAWSLVDDGQWQHPLLSSGADDSIADPGDRPPPGDTLMQKYVV